MVWRHDDQSQVQRDSCRDVRQIVKLGWLCRLQCVDPDFVLTRECGGQTREYKSVEILNPANLKSGQTDSARPERHTRD